MLKPVATKPQPSGYRMVNRAGRGEIYLYGPIGMSWFGDGVTARQFAKDLKELGSVSAIDLRINSEGGSVPEAEAIYTHLVEHKADVTAHIDGMAASAASFIAMAGKEVIISDTGFVMIHDARMIEYGTADEFRRAADLLDRTNEKIVQKYAKRTGNGEKKIRDWMKDETWFIGEEAVTNGFADRVVENLKIAAIASEAVSRLQNTLSSHPGVYRHVPGALMPRRAALRATLADLRVA